MSSSSSSCCSDVEPMSMEDILPDELLKSVFQWLSLFDILRARAVCKRWHTNLKPLNVTAQFRNESSSTTAQSLCPLVFQRTAGQHDWWGYDSTTAIWQPLPSLTRLPRVDIRPLTGNGKTLIGFKITSVPSQVVVGNPVTSTWQTIPNSTETWGEVGNILLVDHQDATSFQIIAVREDATEIFYSNMWEWTKLRNRPAEGVDDSTVLFIKDKLISATLCAGLLFCYSENKHINQSRPILVSFDVLHERWTDDCIPIPPHASPRFFQMLECGGNLFAAIEDPAKATIGIWGLGLRHRQFFGPMVEMPHHLYTRLQCMNIKPGRSKPLQLKAVGHKHRMFFWRKFSKRQTLCIVVFDFLLRTWDVLPEFHPGIGQVPAAAAAAEDPDDLQIIADTGSFEP